MLLFFLSFLLLTFPTNRSIGPYYDIVPYYDTLGADKVLAPIKCYLGQIKRPLVGGCETPVILFFLVTLGGEKPGGRGKGEATTVALVPTLDETPVI